MEYRQVIIDTIAACRINHYPFCEKYVPAAEELLAKNDVYAEPDHTPFNEAQTFCFEQNPDYDDTRAWEKNNFPNRLKSSIGYCRRLDEYANHWTSVQVGDPNCSLLPYWVKPCFVLRRK